MKLVATDIFDFNSWYRFNQKKITEEILIDFDTIGEISNDILFSKIGAFEEDSDKFFVSLNSIDLKKKESSNFYTITIDSIHSIIPFNEKAKQILSKKFPDFKIEDPIDESIANKIFQERNKYFAELGGFMLLSIFGITKSYQEYATPFIKGLQKYNNDARGDSLIDNIIFYERSRPYPNDDSGFLFDVGSIAKTHFNISDDDLKYKEDLKTQDIDKYELIEEVLNLSIFLQNNNSKGVFGPLIQETNQSQWLKKLNSDLNLIPESININNLLVIAFYLKFRYLIRNTSNLSESNFQHQVKHILSNAEKEASIALFLNGMFFGSLKFRELYYELNPLPFSKNKYVLAKENEIKLGDKPIKEKEIIQKEVGSDKKSQIPSLSNDEITIILSCFDEKDIIELQEIKDIIKEKTGNTLGRGFKQLEELLKKIPDIEVVEKSSPRLAKRRKPNETSNPDLFSQFK